MDHHFDIKLATELKSIEAAIIYKNLCYWVIKNKANNKHFYNGYYWTYNSVKAFLELFPYMTRHTIDRALKLLESNNYIQSGNFNQSNYDRTKWYSVIQEIDLLKNGNGLIENQKPIPVNKPITKPDSKPDSMEQNKNFATPTNQLDLEIEANKIEAEQLALNNQKEKKEKSCAKKESRFIKPNIDEIKDYFFEIGCENYNLESEKFFDYYESNGWQVGKSKMKDWKATARNWNRNTKKFNNGQTNNTSTATGNAYEWKPNLQEQLESAAEHLRKINSF